jgi:adenylate kinase family enzyme
MAEAILLLGPTGSGKSPLGDHLERTRPRHRHFDFGRILREVDAGRRRVAGLGAADLDVIHDCLRTGALLEKEHLGIAESVLRDFLAVPAERVVLNGLPRHAGQVGAVDRHVEVTTVVFLECSREVVAARIAADTGGDRAGRADDDAAAVDRRLEVFRRRTQPLVDHYRARGATIVEIAVGPDTRPADIDEVLPC